MTRSELVQVMSSKQTDLTEKELGLAVKYLLESLSDALAKGNRIEIRGFGSFSVRLRRPRIARNPKTGAFVHNAAKGSVHFKAGKEMRDGVMKNKAENL